MPNGRNPTYPPPLSVMHYPALVVARKPTQAVGQRVAPCSKVGRIHAAFLLVLLVSSTYGLAQTIRSVKWAFLVRTCDLLGSRGWMLLWSAPEWGPVRRALSEAYLNFFGAAPAVLAPSNRWCCTGASGQVLMPVGPKLWARRRLW